MVAMGSPRFTRSLVSTLHAAPLCRLQTELGDLAAAAHLQSTGGTVLRSMDTISGRATSMSARSGGQVLKQESRPQRRHSDTAWMVLTKLRVNLGLTIATMAE